MSGAGRRRRLRGPDGPQGPWVLGIACGGDVLSVALWRLPEAIGTAPAQWRLADDVSVHRGHRHADVVMRLVDEACARQEIAPSELALIAVGRGPGGFTGVRVGLATALGISLGTGAGVWPVCSLAALAQHAAGRPGVIVPLIDARRGEVYGAAFEVPSYGIAQTILAPRVAPCDVVLTAIGEAAKVSPMTQLGSGATCSGVASEVPPSWHQGAARHVAALAARAWEAAGRDVAAAPSIEPAYIRPSDAELSRQG